MLLGCGSGLTVCTYVKTDQTLHLKFVHVRVFQLYFNKAKKLEIMGINKKNLFGGYLLQGEQRSEVAVTEEGG